MQNYILDTFVIIYDCETECSFGYLIIIYDAAWRVVSDTREMSMYCSNESDWWEAENEHGEVGAIPRNYVTSDNDAKESQT